ncbi:MAG TPA: ATP-binding protein, partial [Thermoanaerobaculia bacterium]|nr:ATP-binding protein [Thermoanaerobaculia bacterium]
CREKDAALAELEGRLTDQQRIEEERAQLFRILESERSRLARVFMKAPAFIATLRGPDQVFELVNPTFEQLVGFRDILGKPVRQALPELAGQGFFELLDQVYRTGESFTGRERPIHLQREPGGPLDERAVDFVYLPLLDPGEKVSGIFVHGVDVTEPVRARRRLEELVQELQQAEEALKEADRRKDEFLAMLGHELRNPLAPIRNAVFVMRQLGSGVPEIERGRDMIDRQVSHLARLVDDLLDVSRISRGKILLRQEALDLVALARTAAEDHRSDLEAAGLHLSVRLPEGPVWVQGDPTRLSQVLGNLLHNAGKFTDAGGRVELEMVADPAAAFVGITLRDTGIGMEPRMVERLFQAFSQADHSLDRSRGGLGLGLALVKGLVDLHGGEVHAASDGLGRGSVFTLRLPRREAAEPAGSRPEAAPAPPGLHRILVIEDNVDAAESMQLLLELAGHQVTTAFDGPSGVSEAHRFQPSVVLCDIGLPGDMDGYAVARELRRDGLPASAKLIALTGYGQEEDQRRSREAGFDLHLTKPVDPAALGKLLAELPAGA